MVLERTERKKIVKNCAQFLLPIILGTVILLWTYHGFDFSAALQVFESGFNYTWMLVSLLFGVLGHVFRGWRWNLSLEPLGENPKRSNSVYAIFVSYAANLLLPRLGEVSRCGILAKYDGVSFSKSLGTVVAERLIDMLCVGLLTGVTLLMQLGIFTSFFERTGTNVASLTGLFSSTNFYITLLCIAAAIILLVYLLRHLSFFTKIKDTLNNIWLGVSSLRRVKHKGWFIFYTLAIWVCYFFHFYLCFYCFHFTASLGWSAGLVLFVAGTIAVIVPTPNGAGPWHFAIITMMMMYGISKEEAGIFALLVHGIQSFLLILLGVYGLVALPLTNKK